MKDLLILGLDGGASKVNGRLIEWNKVQQNFSLIGDAYQKYYNEFPDFDPNFKIVDLHTQLKERSEIISQNINEKKQSKSYIQAFTEVIYELCKNKTHKKIIIGIGMPGLKSADARGIEVIANGPRMPHFTDELENELKGRGIRLEARIGRLGSDADYCGLGEEYGSKGLFKKTNNAYYIGGGTGVADALKLKGKILPFDQAKDWIAKAWELKTKSGISMEQIVSARGIQKTYADITKTSLEILDREKIYPSEILRLANEGQAEAQQCMSIISINLADLIYERMQSVFEGWSSNFYFLNPEKKLKKQHPYIATLLDKVIIGQRLGFLMAESKDGGVLYEPFIQNLSDKISENKNEVFKTNYLNQNILKKDFIKISNLRDAPALGAGIDSFFQYQSMKVC